MNAPFWSQKELQLLRDHYPRIGIRCAELIDRPRDAVKNKAQQLKLKREWPDGHPPKSKRIRTIANTSPSRDGFPPSTSSIWSYAESVGRELHL